MKLAREIAMGIHDLDVILANNGVETEAWEEIKKHTRFQQLLDDQVSAWNSAINANERVKVKAAALIEEWLPELNTRLHDSKENLDHKIKAATLAARLAGMGITGAGMGDGEGSRFSVTINLGASQKLTFDKVVPASAVIEGEVLDDGK